MSAGESGSRSEAQSAGLHCGPCIWASSAGGRVAKRGAVEEGAGSTSGFVCPARCPSLGVSAGFSVLISSEKSL
jgi:hypothetical protein